MHVVFEHRCLEIVEEKPIKGGSRESASPSPARGNKGSLVSLDYQLTSQALVMPLGILRIRNECPYDPFLWMLRCDLRGVDLVKGTHRESNRTGLVALLQSL